MTAYILRLFSGIGAFLIGMRLISSSLTGIAGGKIEELFKKLGNNKLAAVGVGVGSAAVLQSSSATTVILLGLVNAGIVSLFQATCIIMGANIGTTVTALIISFNSLPIAEIFAFTAFIGAMIFMAAKKEKIKTAGWVLAALGLIFIGLDVIRANALSLKESTTFVSLFQNLSSPLLLIMIGVVFTSVIQSSSAVTGIVLTLAELGIMPVTGTFYVIMGSNVGSCATAMLAAMGGSANMKRTALIHLAFNMIGVLIFLPFVVAFGEKTVEALSFFGVASLVAYFHIVFNLVTTLILLPFVKAIADFSASVIPAVPRAKRTGNGVR